LAWADDLQTSLDLCTTNPTIETNSNPRSVSSVKDEAPIPIAAPVRRANLPSSSAASGPTSTPDTLRTLRFRAWGDSRPPGVQRPILARLRRAVGRLYGRWQAMQFSSLLDNRCRGNARRFGQPLRAAALARGHCPCLQPFASSCLQSHCARRAAGGTALPSAPCSTRRVGAMDR
jgi:hypothetical protein